MEEKTECYLLLGMGYWCLCNIIVSIFPIFSTAWWIAVVALGFFTSHWLERIRQAFSEED